MSQSDGFLADIRPLPLEQVSPLNSDLEALHSKRRHNSAALISTLPNELLGAIFLHGREGQNGQHDQAVGAVATQFVNASRPLEAIRRSSIDRISAHLERSKGAQLSIQVNLYRQDTELTKLFAETIRPHFHRCIRLDITDDTFVAPHHILPLDERLCGLRELNVSVAKPHEDLLVTFDEIDLVLIPPNIPFNSLHFASIRSVAVPMSLRGMITPNLEVFAADIHRGAALYREFALFCASCEKLQRLRLKHIGIRLGVPQTSIRLPNLQLLDLSGGIPHQFFFEVSPSVKHLITSSELPPFSEGWTLLEREQRYPFPYLKTARINIMGYELPAVRRAKMADFLTNQHFLTAVELTSARFSAEILRAFTSEPYLLAEEDEDEPEDIITSPTSATLLPCPDLTLLHLNAILVDGMMLRETAEALEGSLERILSDRTELTIVWSTGHHFIPKCMVQLIERLSLFNGRFKWKSKNEPNPMAAFVTFSDDLVE